MHNIYIYIYIYTHVYTCRCTYVHIRSAFSPGPANAPDAAKRAGALRAAVFRLVVMIIIADVYDINCC